MKKLIPILGVALLATLFSIFPGPSIADAQVGWGRSSVRNWFFGQSAAEADGSVLVFVAGYLPAATEDTEADIWGGGGELNWPAAEGTVTVVSTSANDDGAPVGTGALTITISGLDGDYEAVTETLTLNGLTGVTGTETFLRINLVTVATVGTGGENAGAITGGIGGDEIFRILAGRNATNRAVYTIPDECAGYIVSYYATSEAEGTETYSAATTTYWESPTTYTTTVGTVTLDDGSIEVYLARRNNASLKTERGPIILTGNAHMHDFKLPLKVSEQTDIYLHTYSRGVTIVSGGFALWQICDVAGWL